MAHDPITGGGSPLPPSPPPPTKRLRRGKAASPWQERRARDDSPPASAPRRRFRRTAPRVHSDTQTADTVSGARPGARLLRWTHGLDRDPTVAGNGP
jgi:hypothetical protein